MNLAIIRTAKRFHGWFMRCVRCRGRKEIFKVNGAYCLSDNGGKKVTCPCCSGAGEMPMLEVQDSVYTAEVVPLKPEDEFNKEFDQSVKETEKKLKELKKPKKRAAKKKAK